MFIICLHPGVYTLNNRFASERGILIAAIKINITSAVRLYTEQTNQKIISHLPKQWENSQVIIQNFERYMIKTDKQFEMPATKV